jgi:hypothetical protein
MLTKGHAKNRGYSGFGAHQLMHTRPRWKFWRSMPIRIEFIETAAKVEEILPTLYQIVGDGLIEVRAKLPGSVLTQSSRDWDADPQSVIGDDAFHQATRHSPADIGAPCCA